MSVDPFTGSRVLKHVPPTPWCKWFSMLRNATHVYLPHFIPLAPIYFREISPLLLTTSFLATLIVEGAERSVLLPSVDAISKDIGGRNKCNAREARRL